MLIPLPQYFQNSIKRLILTSFVVVLLLPIGFLAYSLSQNSWDNAQQGMLEKHKLIATALVEPFSLYIMSKQKSLQVIGEEIFHYEYEQVYIYESILQKKVQSILDSHLNSFGDLVSISYESSLLHGHHHHVSTKLDKGTPIKTPHYGGLPLSKLPTDDVNKNGIDLLSPMFFSSITGKPVMLLKHYIKDRDDNIAGALFIEISLTYVSRMCDNINFGVKGHCAVVDSMGQVISHPNKDWVKKIKDLSGVSIVKKMMDGVSGTTEFYSPFLDLDMVAGFASIDPLGWGVMIPQPKKELTNIINDLRNNTIVWLWLGVLIALVIAYILADKITRPISVLLERTREVDSGYDYTGLGSIPSDSPREISLLWESISNLVLRLQRSNEEVQYLNESLKEDITQATAELRDTNERLTNISNMDDLTSLPNRRCFTNKINQILKDGLNTSVAIILIDIDNFKSINDTFGHDAGDFALKRVSTIFMNIISKEDMIARLGGDEFVMYIGNATTEEVALSAEKLRSSVDELDLLYNGNKLELSLSIGTINVKELDSMTLGGLLQLADKAMYQSKEKGRNCVTAYQIVDRKVRLSKSEKLSEEDFSIDLIEPIDLMDPIKSIK